MKRSQILQSTAVSEVAFSAISRLADRFFRRPGPGIRIAVDGRMYDAIDALEKRTQAFAVDVINYCRRLPRFPGFGRIPDQLSGAATSVGSNHRAMRRARSKREFASKLQFVVEESDEAVYWLEVTTTASPETEGGNSLLGEAREFRAIVARARATNRERR